MVSEVDPQTFEVESKSSEEFQMLAQRNRKVFNVHPSPKRRKKSSPKYGPKTNKLLIFNFLGYIISAKHSSNNGKKN